MEDLLTCTEPNFWKSNRIKTYTHWPFSNKDECSAEKMAAAGFVAIGGEKEPDLVECFVCGKQLDGWEPNDNPWLEHANHQPSCEFVKLNKLDETKWTFKEYITLLKENKKLYFKKKIEETMEKARSANNTALDQIVKSFEENRNGG